MPKVLLFFAFMLIAFGRVSPALANPPVVENVLLGTGYVKNKVVGASTTFAPTDFDIVCVLRLKGVDKTSQYMARWFVVKLDEQQDFKVNDQDKLEHAVLVIETDTTKPQRANLFTSTLRFAPPKEWPAEVGPPPRHWATGTYRVEWLRRDAKLKGDYVPLRVINFTIKAPSAPAP